MTFWSCFCCVEASIPIRPCCQLGLPIPSRHADWPQMAATSSCWSLLALKGSNLGDGIERCHRPLVHSPGVGLTMPFYLFEQKTS